MHLPARLGSSRWVLALTWGLLATSLPAAYAAPPAALHAYASEAEFGAALARWRTKAAALQPQRHQADAAKGMFMPGLAFNMAPMPAAAPNLAKAAAESAVPGAATAADAITNVQTAGVDEGGIVKRAGDHLVILRRGRLFTVRVGGDDLAPVAAVDAFGPGMEPQGAWYDELLISGSTVVVVGYSHARGGTEIGLFELRADGRLQYQATGHLRSFDYFSSRNYASRLVGHKLIFYTPSPLQAWGHGNLDNLPGLRRWQGQRTAPGFQRILPATRIFRTDDDFDPEQPLALHTVTSCELLSRAPEGELACESTAVLGPVGRVFYVSAGSVYVWTHTTPRAGSAWRTPGFERTRARSAVYRLPLDGAAPTALKTAGVPVDQMSFLEDASGHLNVLLRETGPGEGMWGAERSRGGMALLRVPLAALGDGHQAAERLHYRPLPDLPPGEVNNRYVGDWLLWGSNPDTQALALRYSDPTAQPQRLNPGHAVERIEALGAHALLVGNQGDDLHMSTVRLSPAHAELAQHHVQAGSRQGESRSHGYYYRPTGDDDGLLGLPIVDASKTTRRDAQQGERGSASVTFLRQHQLSLRALGTLQAQPDTAGSDHCKASCVDWYGNARPLFIGERVLALLGDELVEGRIAGSAWRERLGERRRINFAAPWSRGWEDR